VKGVNLRAKDVVDLVKQDYINEQKSLYSNLDGDTLLQLLGPDIANKIRKYDIGRVKAKSKPLHTPSKQPSQAQPKKQKLSKDDWKARLDKIKNGE
jgi:hypothetical protein